MPAQGGKEAARKQMPACAAASGRVDNRAVAAQSNPTEIIKRM
jgi:hypothetical protein